MTQIAAVFFFFVCFGPTHRRVQVFGVAVNVCWVCESYVLFYFVVFLFHNMLVRALIADVAWLHCSKHLWQLHCATYHSVNLLVAQFVSHSFGNMAPSLFKHLKRPSLDVFNCEGGSVCIRTSKLAHSLLNIGIPT